jgi:RNA polymerase sigma factor (sigma-70 family)
MKRMLAPHLPNVRNIDAELASHHQAATGWALACCQWDRSAAEDVLQTAYLKIMDGRAGFADLSQFRAFLFGVIRHTASEERRRRLVRRTVSLGLATDHVTDGDALAPIVRAESSARLIEALKQLPPRQREVLHLVFYGELTVSDAAIAMGVSVGSARVHYDRGKTRLRHLLGSDR